MDLWRSYVARIDAEELLREALGRDFDEEEFDQEVEAGARRRFDRMVKRRVEGEPIALIRGYVEFRGLRLSVRPGVFTPRFSSESLAGAAIEKLRGLGQPTVVDVACGGGAVALAVASEVPGAYVYGIDIGPAAVALGRHNARRLNLSNVRFSTGDLLLPLPLSLRGAIDVVTIHPPYVSRSQLRTLPREVRDYEPPESLSDQSRDGLGIVRRLAPEAWQWLRPGGWLMVEVAPDLARAVRGLLVRNRYRSVRSHRDSVGATRVVVGSCVGMPPAR